MADNHRSGYRSSQLDGYDERLVPDYHRQFVAEADIEAFALALSAPEPSPNSEQELVSPITGAASSPSSPSRSSNKASFDANSSARRQGGLNRVSSAVSSSQSVFITAQNDWAPVHNKTKPSRRKSERSGDGRLMRRSVDESREGSLYHILKWPLFFFVGLWIVGLAMSYLWTRFYIWTYEHFIAWRGKRQILRRRLWSTTNYEDWVTEAKEMDQWAGNEEWKSEDSYAYYDHKTVKRVLDQIRRARRKAERQESALAARNGNGIDKKAVMELKALVEACVKNNFVGVENPRLYSQTYYGTKALVQEFVDEVKNSVTVLSQTSQLGKEEKRGLFKRMHTNYGRTALCLSGGATFAYYHFGVCKALLDADLMPEVITGTSGGAIVAALLCTRTDAELRKILVPALAGKLKACSEPITTWFPRWWRTGARFDALDWARGCSWFTRGSMTFRESFERTGRILNVSCVPADPHSPTILCNYLTSPDCVIWSAVLASAAVPGILNPVVLMMKQHDGTLAPYSFGHKWKDGSLRTDIPLKALNLHFNVNFSIVSQVNPHVNLFFFSSRGSVGQPVTHRKGRGWRGGFIGSATEQYLKLDLTKWLKVLRHLELLPRPMGQDWSNVWLQQFSGTVTIWPRTETSDLWRILSDPDERRLGRMIQAGQQSAFPKLKFLANRLQVERGIEAGRRASRPPRDPGLAALAATHLVMSEDELLRGLKRVGADTDTDGATTADEYEPALGLRDADADAAARMSL